MKTTKLFLTVLFLLLMGAAKAQMVLEYDIATPNTTIALPLNGNVNVSIDWGDGSAPEYLTTASDYPHTYATIGTKTVTISGSLTQFGGLFKKFNGNARLTKVLSWDGLGLLSLDHAFNGASLLTQVPTSLPSSVTNLGAMFLNASIFNQPLGIWNTTNITNMYAMFYGASSFNQPIGSWNTTNVTNMGWMFNEASAFNQPIGNWNTANVIDMSFMFSSASSFNQPIGNWNTANVIGMIGMFYGADIFNQPIEYWNTVKVANMSMMFSEANSFNQPIGNWNTSAVTDMNNMFWNANAFNQPIGTWNTAKVANMSTMFRGANSFNQPIGNWNTGNVKAMNHMFGSAISFNQPIDNWNTSAVTDMSWMFANAISFNQPIDNWNTSAVTDISSMFYDAISFNQPIDNWNTSAVTDMNSMFQNAISFNQPIGTWNTSTVTDMNYMFAKAHSFNQPIGSWNIANVTDMGFMFSKAGLCTDNYDNLLNGWAPQLVKTIDFDGGYSKYSTVSESARALLISKGWSIIDAGLGMTKATKCPIFPTSVISGSKSICAGNSSNISIELIGTPPWGLTYTDGITPVSVTGITSSPYTFAVSPNSTSTYTVTALSDSKYSALAADMTGSAVITVNPRPTTDISSSQTICVGNKATISIPLTGEWPWHLTYTDGTTPVNVTWINTSPYTFEVSPNTTTTYTVTALSDWNCSAKEDDMIGSAKVFVNPIPDLTKIKLQGDTVCNASSATIFISGTSSGQQFSIWNNQKLIASSAISNGGNVNISIPNNQLLAGLNMFTGKVHIKGCDTLTFRDSVLVLLNNLSNTNHLSAKGDTICNNSSEGILSISGTKSNEFFSVWMGKKLLATQKSIGGILPINIPRNLLSLGVNKMTIKVMMKGCDTLSLKDTATIIVNKEINVNNLAISGDTICINSQSAFVTIKGVNPNEKYTLKVSNSTLASATSNSTNDLKIEIPRSLLTSKTNKILAFASIKGCSIIQLKDAATVLINEIPKTDLSVGTNGPVCNGNQARFFILKPETGTIYQIFDGQNAVSQTGIGKGDSLILSLNKLSIGDHELKARATNAGCNVAEIGASGKITVNSAPKTDLEAFINGPVCLKNAAEVKIYPSEIGKFYEVQKNLSAISDQKIGNGDTLKLTVNTTTLQAGEHKLTVGVSVAGCVADTLVSNLKLKINTDPKTDLSVGTNGPVCDGNQAKFFILKPETGTSYQIFDGQNAVSQTGIGKGDSLILSLNKLSIGDHELKARATNAGCNVAELGASGKITINSSPKTNLETFINGPVCLGNAAEIKIYPSEIGKFYEVQRNRLAISESKLGTGDTLKLAVNTTTLQAGEHKLTVGVSVPGCVADTLVSNLKLKINTDPKTDLSVGTNGPVCDGNQAKFFILKPEIGTSYQIFDGQTAVSQAGIGVKDSLILVLNQLSIGDHTLKARATNAGCKITEIGASGKITINSAPRTNLDAFINGPVCLGNEVEVKIFPSEIGKFYEVQKNRAAISDQKTGTGDTLKLTVNTTTLQAGEHKLVVGVSVAGCVADTLVSNLKLKINTDPKTDLSVGTNGPVCDGNQAKFFILKPETGTTYQIFDGQNAVSQTGIGKDDSLILTLNQLLIGDHELKARATNAGCNVAVIGASGKITINSAPKTNLEAFINGPVCLGNEAEVKIYPSEIGKFYEVRTKNTSISDQKVGTGDTLKLTVNTTTLQAGEHKLTVGVSVPGCVADTLVSNLKLKINTDPKTNLTVGTNGPVCDGNQAKFFILKPETGTTYQIFDGQNAVSQTGIGKDDSLILTLNQLLIGDHELKARATNAGCNVAVIGASGKITINSAPRTNLEAFINGPVCLKNAAEVKIYPSEIGKFYEVRTKNTSISDQKTGTGDTLKLTVNTTNLQAGEHKLTVSVSVAGCVADTLVSNLKLKINTDPKTNLTVGTNGPVCDGNQAKFFILKPETGTSYQIFDGQKAVSQTGIGVKDSLILILNQLSIGDHELKARATNAGCNVAVIGASGKITINSAPKTNLEAFINGPVCLGNEAEVKICPSEIGKYYEVRTKNTSISDQKTGTGDTLKLTVNTTTLLAGEHKLTVGVSVAGCVADTLVSNLKLKINTETRSDISFLKGSSICMNEELAQVTVLKAEKDIHYRMSYFNTVYAKMGTGEDLVFEIPKDSLSQGRNEVSFYATSHGCKTVKLDNTANVFLMGSKNTIQGASILCYNSIGNFSINPIEGALSYNWTVPLVDTLLSGQGTNQVRVSIGQKESEIKVVPVSTNRACQESEASLNVQVFPRFRGLNFQKTDTACINQTYLFSLDSTFAIGVKSLKWTWTSGIRIESPIDSSTRKAQGIFVQSGIQQLILSPTEECTGLVRKPDTLTIRVLEYPVAEAGEYDVIENDLQQPIFLNGTGSSENGINLNEKYFINWTSPNLFVQNAHLLVNASFVPVDEETKVYLSVAHAGNQGRGYCEAKDSVVIKIKPMIEVPNVFSPNQDGVHDAWEIPHLNRLFPNCTVEVFNKWGAQVHQSTGYNEPWDGTRNGQELPISTYYYIIDLKNGSKPMVKSVTILK